MNLFTGIVEAKDVGSGSNAHLGQWRSETKMMQHVRRIGAYLETGSDFTQFECLLEDRDVMPCAQKTCSGGQSADPGSGNEDPVPGHSMLLPVAHLLLSSLSLFFFHLRVVAKNSLLVESQSTR